VKSAVKSMGRVQSIQLLVMPDPWYEYVKTKGESGECPETFEECEKMLKEYTGNNSKFYYCIKKFKIF
jgi:hypothetical protein